MKKFSKMLTLGLALTMAFGMSVSVSASDVTGHVYGVSEDVPNDSVVTEDPTVPEQPNKVPGAAEADQAVFVKPEYWTAEEIAAANTAVNASKPGTVLFGKEVETIVNVYMMEAPDDWNGEPVTVTFNNMPSLGKGEGFVLYHFNADGTFKEEIAVTWNGKAYQAVIKNFSPFVLVKVKDNGTVEHTNNPYTYGGLPDGVTAPAAANGAPVSPKTGEM